jgi:DNA-binding MarR family transcriptional regulator
MVLRRVLELVPASTLIQERGGPRISRTAYSIVIRFKWRVVQMAFSGRDVRSETHRKNVSVAGYRQLAEFRYHIRQFLHFSEEAARSQGIEPQQHQLLLAIKGLPGGTRPTVTALSYRLCLRHHSTVELVDRLVEHGAVKRRPSDKDHREVFIELTAHGEELLHRLSILHWEELRVSGPALSEALEVVVHHSITHRRKPT